MITIKESVKSQSIRKTWDVRLHLTDGPDMEFVAIACYVDKIGDPPEAALFKLPHKKRGRPNLAEENSGRYVAYRASQFAAESSAKVFEGYPSAEKIGEFLGYDYTAKGVLMLAGFDYVTRIE